MQEHTQIVLNMLKQANWFSAVGEQEQADVLVLPSWEEAIKSCASASWENVQLEAANLISDVLVVQYRERYQLWNVIAEEVKATTIPLIQRKISPVIEKHSLPKVFEDSVNWDIVHIGIAAEYVDLYPPRFHALCAYWYIKGHFPCGWDGDFPNGRLIIY
jgi:hypothetical protein